VELLVREYLATDPDPAVLAVVRDEMETLVDRHGKIVATTFRQYPSYPQRYVEVLAEQPAGPDVPIVAIPPSRAVVRYGDGDIVNRDITALVVSTSRRAA
jgi:hypothetical protein